MPTYGEMRTPQEIELDRKVLNKVLAGIEFLQEKYGDDWVDKIDLNTLQLASAQSCVLGQFGRNTGRGDYHDMVGLLRIGDGAARGFAAHRYEEYPALDRVWKREITRLRAEKAQG